MSECKDCIHYKACMHLIDTEHEVLVVCEHFNEVKRKFETTEYIEKEKAIEICENYRKRCLEMHDWCGDTTAVDIKEEIEKLPISDVVEVRHAYWKKTTHITESKRRREIHSKLYNCSYCDAPNGRKKSSYCHWCGAKMDGERKEQE